MSKRSLHHNLLVVDNDNTFVAHASPLPLHVVDGADWFVLCHLTDAGRNLFYHDFVNIAIRPVYRVPQTDNGSWNTYVPIAGSVDAPLESRKQRMQ